MGHHPTESRPGWGLDERPPVKQGWTWMGTFLLLALVALVLAYYAATSGCASGDFVLIKIMRCKSELETIVEVQSDANDSDIPEGQEDVPGADSSRDIGAFLELWPR